MYGTIGLYCICSLLFLLSIVFILSLTFILFLLLQLSQAQSEFTEVECEQIVSILENTSNKGKQLFLSAIRYNIFSCCCLCFHFVFFILCLTLNLFCFFYYQQYYLIDNILGSKENPIVKVPLSLCGQEGRESCHCGTLG